MFKRPLTVIAAVCLALGAIGVTAPSPQAETGVPMGRTQSVTLQSSTLGEDRTLKVHLPVGYENSDRAYPVLYVLDAEWIFDYAAASVDFLSGSIAGRVPPMIVVGINNTDRTRDMTVGLDTTATFINFVSFLETEIIPHVDNQYRTNAHRGLYGWSSASGLCLWMLFTRPEVFTTYIATGAGIGPKTREFARAEFAKHDYSNNILVVSTEGDMPPRVEALNQMSELLKESAPAGLTWTCEVMADEDHVSVLSKGLYAGLETAYADYKLPADIVTGVRAAIAGYLERLSDRYGFEVGLSEGAANDAAVYLIHQDKIESALDVVRLGIEHNPRSAGLYDSLGEVLEMAGSLQESADSFGEAVRIGEATDDPHLPRYQSNLARVKEALDR